MSYVSRYLGAQSLDEVLRNPEEFDKLLDRVVGVALERALIHVPKILLTQIESSKATAKMVEEFYLVNRDLRPYKSMVATEITRLCSEDPSLKMEEVLVRVAKEIRSKVGNNNLRSKL